MRGACARNSGARPARDGRAAQRRGRVLPALEPAGRAADPRGARLAAPRARRADRARDEGPQERPARARPAGRNAHPGPRAGGDLPRRPLAVGEESRGESRDALLDGRKAAADQRHRDRAEPAAAAAAEAAGLAARGGVVPDPVHARGLDLRDPRAPAETPGGAGRPRLSARAPRARRAPSSGRRRHHRRRGADRRDRRDRRRGHRRARAPAPR